MNQVYYNELTKLLNNYKDVIDNDEDIKELNKILALIKKGGYTPTIIKKISSLFGRLKPLLGYSNKSKQTLKKYGDCRIIGLTIYRTPLSDVLMSTLNLISLGKWGKSTKKYSFDKFFHLALVATVQCDNEMKNIIIEKNEVVNISTSYNTNSETQIYPLAIDNGINTLNTLMAETLNMVGDKSFFYYDPFYNNCQYFIRYILEANKINTIDAEKFLFQDITQILKETPTYLHRFGRKITDLAATFTRLIGGCNTCENANKTRKLLLNHINSL